MFQLRSMYSSSAVFDAANHIMLIQEFFHLSVIKNGLLGWLDS